MIDVNVVDFSECHYEEVISFFWRSVYLHKGYFGNVAKDSANT